ncbi:hypothetical protein [Pseudomonas monteilii]|uniref:hypothetical protein n=1 Tax=Pseudomonas monteilii TaxID=76759 RepID=UPI0013787F32|nr:hypothetical protein [Pseudomonas monteilii]NBB07887.1 hypothetical protein [Pseudomonas monteilii]
MTDFTPNPAMDAAIEAKIDAAFKSGITFEGVDPSKKDQYDALMEAVGFTAEEQRYAAEQGIYKMAQAAIGEKIFAAINAGMKISQEDIIPCLEAYFDTVDVAALSKLQGKRP